MILGNMERFVTINFIDGSKTKVNCDTIKGISYCPTDKKLVILFTDGTIKTLVEDKDINSAKVMFELF